MSQDSSTVRQMLTKRDVHFGTDFVLKHRVIPYINVKIFKEYICSVFISNLNELRNLEQFVDKDTVLLIDNYPSHIGKLILVLLCNMRVYVIT
jgi:hypothetical protein